ncbi:peptidase S9 [Cellulomonas shaoxiangyii]|uniref:Peptidase S9 n=1 Tax=Cellulomonas shaoxiangyii TaxID=2566013 RepID=A0A4P7SM40_9CELL|nr:peptidase S9 [Cellulomonas shaoxiangyii]QCB95031.1 peptidase S9 [Cellulomonas shaoxiangyii]TGY86360.1 peptidase S9 [Cellulomonas shaoxiangyii]
MTTARARTTTALLTGLTTAAYYAVPDVARTRAARGWLKAACVAAGAAVALPDARQAWTELQARRRRTALDGIPVATENLAQSVLDNAGDGPARSATARTVVRGAVVVAVAVAGSVAVTVAFERWVFRRGEARAAAGVRLAHTRTGLVLGALTAAGGLIPDPSEGR